MNYLDPKVLASLEGLDIQARRVVEGYIAGMHKSPFQGISVEFAEHREYVPGDDIRHVDWKAWSKTDKWYLKQYEQETNLITYILLDVSESMTYASPGCVSKLEYARIVAASLTYMTLQQQDSVGLATFDDRVRDFLRPAGQPSQLREAIHVMDVAAPREKTNIEAIFHDLAERFKRKGIVIILSDCFDETRNILDGLKHLLYRRHDVIVFQILDPAELDFPFLDTTLFKGLEGLPEILTEPRALRDAYQAEIGSFIADLKKGCRKVNIDYVLLRTDEPLDRSLSSYLASRMRRMKK